MKQLLIVCIVTMLVACSKRENDNGVRDSNLAVTYKDSVTTKSALTDNGESYLTSTYDGSSKDLRYHKATLKELSDSGVFSIIHAKLFSALSKKHQDYFTSKPDYALLYSTPGDLFQNAKEDNAFIVYDKKYSRVSILLYDDLKNSYSELFRDIRVKDGLETADCNYGSFGTLDYQVADELIYQRNYLMKKPESHLEYSACKIVAFSKDDDLILNEGCFAKNFSVDFKSTSYCIPTSSVYNNWECLTYDKAKNIFIIFYGQAFAD